MADLSILFYPGAVNQSLNAHNWYKNVHPELSLDFREPIKKKLESIKQNPKYSSVIYKNVRSNRMKRFPLNIIYIISNLQIQFIAVFHHSRNPYEWKTRI